MAKRRDQVREIKAERIGGDEKRERMWRLLLTKSLYMVPPPRYLPS